MRSRWVFPSLTLLAMVLPGCAGKPSYDPWLVPSDSFLASTRVIALSPMRLPDGLENPGPVAALFDSLMTDALRAAGFAVVASDIVSDIWNHGADSVGGYYDSMTGRPDTSKLNPLRRYFKQRLRDERGADAVLFPEIMVVGAPFADGQANWDGTSQRVAGWFSILAAAIANSDLPAGTAEGLSLDVQLESIEGGPVFNQRAGIELWAKPSGDGDLTWVPREKLFLDVKRNQKAARLALASVLGEEKGSR